jgi:hypothetical protein
MRVVLKPTMMRRGRDGGAAGDVKGDSGDASAELRANDGENGLLPEGLTVPVIVAPLSATKDTDTPGI